MKQPVKKMEIKEGASGAFFIKQGNDTIAGFWKRDHAEMFYNSILSTTDTNKHLKIIRDLYAACKRYEEKYTGLLQWEIPSFNEAKQIITEKGYPEHEKK